MREVLDIKSSRAQIKISEILRQAGLNFKEEYSFPDLIGQAGHALRFDFAVFDDNDELQFLIEYQGIQHYKPKSIFGGVSGLHKQQYYDMQKREYCKKHGIKLVLIPYWDEYSISYDYIMNLADIL